MIKWFNIRFKYRFWYQVKFEYRVEGVLKMDWTRQIGLAKKSSILSSRDCSKIYDPLHKDKHIPKYILNNGKINMIVLAYLGHLKL